MNDNVRFIPLRSGVTRWVDGSVGISVGKHCSQDFCADCHIHIHRDSGSAGVDLSRADVEALRDALDAILQGGSDE